MAKKETAEAVQPVQPQETPSGTIYTVSEFAKASEKVFGKRISPDIVVAAFRMNNKETATIEEAKEIVGKFANKEVK